MNPLESRKQLLIAESELNRGQFVQDWQTLADEVHAFTKQARNIRTLGSAAVVLVAGLAAWRRNKAAPAAEKPSRWQTILKGAGLISTVWLAFRPPGRDPSGK
jgi:hypothetical protein